MRASVYERYGPPDVVRLSEVDTPVPGAGDVLIRVHATTVTSEDCTFRRGRPLVSRSATGWRRPRVQTLGSNLAGTVEAVGRGVERFSVGDRVVAASGATFGAHAEYACLPATGALAVVPPTMTFGDAVSVSSGGLTALPFLRDSGHLREGQRVLVNGASGAVGTAAVQLAKHFGADVTGVCSTTNVELVQELGADRVIDYTRADFTAGSEMYDVVFDTVGKSSFSRCRSVLKRPGIYLSTVLTAGIVLQMLRTARLSRKRAVIAFTGLRPDTDKAIDLAFLLALAEAGTMRPVIDRRYALDEIAEAHRYVDGGHKRGNVVIDVIPDGDA